jgi:hypothetical protein
MKFLASFFLAVVALWSLPAWAQPSVKSVLPECTRAQLAAGTCAPARIGTTVRISNADEALDADCATGEGANNIVCVYDGTNWRSAAILRVPSAGVVAVGDATNTTSVQIVSDAGTLVVDGDVTLDPEETTTFAAPNAMLQTTLATGFALHKQYEGIPKLNVTHIAAVGDGTGTVAVANPLLANCNAIVNGSEADDTTSFITGSSSYEYTWAADVAVDDGIDCVIAYPANDDPTSVGFWFMTDTVITAGDIDINFDDGGVEECTVATLAVPAADLNVWHWVEIDITAACAAAGDGTDGIEFLATAQGAAAGVLDDAVMNIDMIAMWEVTDEEAIGNIRVGGLIDFSYALIAAGGANTQVQGVEWTSHFINYQAGADAIIPITDLSAYYGTTLEALE